MLFQLRLFPCGFIRWSSGNTAFCLSPAFYNKEERFNPVRFLCLSHPPPSPFSPPLLCLSSFLFPRPPRSLPPSPNPLPSIPTLLFAPCFLAHPSPSTIRQVPDNQEVYLSTTGLTSLIFDLAERVAHPSPHEPDLEALKFHFEDIVHEGDMSNIIETKQINLPNFP